MSLSRRVNQDMSGVLIFNKIAQLMLAVGACLFFFQKSNLILVTVFASNSVSYIGLSN